MSRCQISSQWSTFGYVCVCLCRYALARGTKEFKSDASDYLLHFGLFGLTILNMMGTASTLYNKTSSDYAIMCVYSLLAMSGSALFKISLDYISSARLHSPLTKLTSSPNISITHASVLIARRIIYMKSACSGIFDILINAECSMKCEKKMIRTQN